MLHRVFRPFRREPDKSHSLPLLLFLICHHTLEIVVKRRIFRRNLSFDPPDFLKPLVIPPLNGGNRYVQGVVWVLFRHSLADVTSRQCRGIADDSRLDIDFLFSDIASSFL